LYKIQKESFSYKITNLLVKESYYSESISKSKIILEDSTLSLSINILLFNKKKGKFIYSSGDFGEVLENII